MSGSIDSVQEISLDEPRFSSIDEPNKFTKTEDEFEIFSKGEFDSSKVCDTLHETIQCSNCFQLPVFAKQCSSCHDLVCKSCYSTQIFQNCPKCIKKTSTLVEVQDKVLKRLLSKFIRFRHKCTDRGAYATFSESDMHNHQTSHVCPSKKFRCHCQAPEEEATMNYNSLILHLKKECDMVDIECHTCHKTL